MILIFEHDSRDHGRGRFDWRPEWFSDRFQGGKMWKLGWGFWSICYYPSPGLRDFTKWIEDGNTEWRSR